MTSGSAWWLRYDRGRGPARSVQLRPGTSLTIGRSSGCDIILDDTKISRSHAKVELGIDGVWVNDLGSGNGTYIDGQRVTSGLWKPGQTLRLGDVQFEIARGSNPAPEVDQRGSDPDRAAGEVDTARNVIDRSGSFAT